MDGGVLEQPTERPYTSPGVSSESASLPFLIFTDPHLRREVDIAVIAHVSGPAALVIRAFPVGRSARVLGAILDEVPRSRGALVFFFGYELVRRIFQPEAVSELSPFHLGR